MERPIREDVNRVKDIRALFTKKEVRYGIQGSP